MKFSPGVRVLLVNVIGCASGLMAAENGPPRPKQDAKGNPIRYAATGHASNYDEAKVGSFVLPDPLVLQNGKPVKDAATWNTVRRPELIALYEREIFGAVPARARITSVAWRWASPHGPKVHCPSRSVPTHMHPAS